MLSIYYILTTINKYANIDDILFDNEVKMITKRFSKKIESKQFEKQFNKQLKDFVSHIQWIPGKINGLNVDSYYDVTIHYD